jgi:hypothetical protein
MDYPFEAAIENAVALFDEVVVVVDAASVDGTYNEMFHVARRFAGHVVIVPDMFVFDRMWQERWWQRASSHTDADWLAYFDLDDIFDIRHIDELTDAMADPAIHLINFPMVHFFGTSSYIKWFAMTRNVRVVRRSGGAAMVNRCTDATPTHAACFMMYGGERTRDAHAERGAHVHMMTQPLLHYGWARNAHSLAMSQRRHRAWYADGDGYEDGHLPDVEPYNFKMAERVGLPFGEEGISKWRKPHPSVMNQWFVKHYAEWHYLNEEAENA